MSVLLTIFKNVLLPGTIGLLAFFTLTFSSQAETYSEWKTANFSAEELAIGLISGDDADPEGDGVPNLLEYALDLDPHFNDASGQPTLGVNNGRLTLSHRYRVETDLAYFLESSITLHGWVRHNNPTVLSETGGVRTVEDSILMSVVSRHFLRLGVLLNPTEALLKLPPHRLYAGNPAVVPVKLEWTDRSDRETAFWILRKEGATGEWGTLGTTAADTCQYVDSTAEAHHDYFYRVVAAFDSEFSDFSEELEVAPDIALKPDTVTTLWFNSLQMRLQWANDPTAASYLIERWNGHTWELVTTLGSNIYEYFDSNVLPTQFQYKYRVVALDSQGNILSISTSPILDLLPDAPSDLEAVQSGSNVQLSWTDNSDNETGFIVEKSADAGATWIALTTVGANITSATASATQDYYRVSAANGTGQSQPAIAAAVRVFSGDWSQYEMVVVSGLDQTGAPGEFAPNPVVILVRHKTTGWPAKDAPVNFHSVSGEYRYALEPEANQAQATLSVLTNAQGLATAYMQFPEESSP